MFYYILCVYIYIYIHIAICYITCSCNDVLCKCLQCVSRCAIRCPFLLRPACQRCKAGPDCGLIGSQWLTSKHFLRPCLTNRGSALKFLVGHLQEKLGIPKPERNSSKTSPNPSPILFVYRASKTKYTNIDIHYLMASIHQFFAAMNARRRQKGTGD